MENWIYKKTKDNSSRFLLGKKGSNMLVVLGINPSTAEPNNLDPTLKRVDAKALINHDGFLMLNVYPQRATDPNDLHQEADLKLHKKNLKYIKEYVTDCSDVWLAFGNIISKRIYLDLFLNDILKLLKKKKCNFICIGINKNGTPKHPLYVKSDVNFEKYDINLLKKQ